MTLIVLRTFVETDLSDTALQVILDAANEDLTRAVGPDTSMIEEREMHGQPRIWLDRPASTITTVTETDTVGTVLTLDATDYRLDPDGLRLTRLATGVNPKSGWDGTVTITYAPADLNRRNRAIVQLVELDLAFRPGARSESVGDFSRTQEDYRTARTKIIHAAQTWELA